MCAYVVMSHEICFFQKEDYQQKSAPRYSRCVHINTVLIFCRVIICLPIGLGGYSCEATGVEFWIQRDLSPGMEKIAAAKKVQYEQLYRNLASKQVIEGCINDFLTRISSSQQLNTDYQTCVCTLLLGRIA